MDDIVKPQPLQEAPGDKSNAQFAMLPRYWFSLDLTGRQFRIGAAILLHFNPKHPGECYPSIDRLHEITSVDVRHIRRDIKALQQRGAINVRRLTKKVNGKNRSSNQYTPRLGPGAETAHGQKQPGQNQLPRPGPKQPVEPRAETAPLTDQGTNHLTEYSAQSAKIAEKDQSAKAFAEELFDLSLGKEIRARHEGRKRESVVTRDLPSARAVLEWYGVDAARDRADQLVSAIKSRRVTKSELSCEWLLETWSWDFKTAEKRVRAPRSSEPHDTRDIGGAEATDALIYRSKHVCSCPDHSCDGCLATTERKRAAGERLAARGYVLQAIAS